jgi:hypothetical protein
MAINVVSAGSGLTGGGSGSTVTLSVADGGIINSMLAADSVLDSNIASGQVVKTFNGLTDAVILAAGQNVTLTPSGNTVTVSSPTTINVTLPLVLTTPDYGATIEGHIAITTTNDGGAVALQTGTPVYQTGFAALNGLHADTNFSLGANKVVFSATGPTLDVSADTLSTFAGAVVLGDTLTVAGTITVGKNLVGTTATIPIIDLVSHSAAVPLFLSTSDIASSLVFKNVDEHAVVNTTLYSDGKFFSRQVSADNFVIGTAEQAAGAVTLAFTGVSLFACDATAAPITFTLPLITANSPSGYHYTFKKTDVSTNQVMVSAQGGQSIDGVTNKIITAQWGSLKLVSVVSGSSGYWLTL